MRDWRPVVALDEVPENGRREVHLDDASVLLVRIGEELFACAAYCPHKGMQLEPGTLEGDCKLTCPLHAATFDLRTGRPNEESGWAGHLPTYPTRIRAGMIEIQLPD